jgi:hypothetical protein
MRTAITLVIAGLLMHATWRVGSAYVTHYEFEDRLEQLVRFAADKSVQEVENKALEVASESELPLLRKDIAVWREDGHTFIEASYSTQIEILPRYHYPWEFAISVEAWSTGAPTVGDVMAAPR